MTNGRCAIPQRDGHAAQGAGSGEAGYNHENSTTKTPPLEGTAMTYHARTPSRPAPNAMCATVTPWTEQGELDEPALRRHLRFLAERGVGVCLGAYNSGEGLLLRRPEVRRLYQIGVEEVKGKTSAVAVCLGYTSTETVIERAQEALSLGVDAVQIYSPRPGPAHTYLTGAEVEAFYADILRQVIGPVYLSFMHSGAAPSVVPPPMIGQLARKYPQVIGVNCATADEDFLANIVRELPPGMPVRVGGTGMLLKNLRLGGVGCLSGEANVAPRLHSDICHVYRTGDVERAALLYDRLVKLSAALKKHSPRSEKAVLSRWGAMGPWLRRPYLPLPGPEARALLALVDEMQVRAYEGVAA